MIQLRTHVHGRRMCRQPMICLVFANLSCEVLGMQACGVRNGGCFCL